MAAPAPAEGIRINTHYYRTEKYDVCEINGSKFAIFFKSLTSDNGDVYLDLGDYNIILLAPIEAQKNVKINGITVVAMDVIRAKTGTVEVKANRKFVNLGGEIRSVSDALLDGKLGVYSFGIIEERLDRIKALFQNGRAALNGPFVVDGLTEVFDAIDDPAAESESDTVKMSDVFKFFAIPH